MENRILEIINSDYPTVKSVRNVSLQSVPAILLCAFSISVRYAICRFATAFVSPSPLTGCLLLAVATSATRIAMGDIINSLDYDPAHQQRGVNRSVAMGGNVGGVEHLRNTGPGLASAAMFNRGGRGFALSAGHVGVFSNFTFFTGWDATNHRGLEYRPVNVEVFPGYSLGMQLGSTPDVAIFTFDGLIEGAPDLFFPDAPLGFGDSLTHGGFGPLGVWGQEPLGQDGIARAGSAILLGGTFINGATSDAYFTANLVLNDPDSSRGTSGSSGNPGQKIVNDINYTYGIVTQGSTATLGTRTQFVRTDLGNTAFHEWFDGRINNALTAVPEPGTFTLAALALATFAFARRRSLRSKR